MTTLIELLLFGGAIYFVWLLIKSSDVAKQEFKNDNTNKDK